MFEGVIGHERVKNFLGQSLATGRVAHAYLFLGPRGVGKMTVARAFAETLLHGEKKSAHALETHPDVTFVSRLNDEKKDIKKTAITIEQIRELRERLSYSSLLPGWKIAIVDEAETMTIEAANALLKTLEEPRGKTVIMLIATDLRRVPQTVQSRTQVIRFGLVPRQVLERELVAQGVSQKRAVAVSQIAAGHPGLALMLGQDEDAFDELQNALTERQALLRQPIYRRLQWAEVRAKKKVDLEDELRLWRNLLRDELVRALDAADLQVTSYKLQALRRLMESEDALRHHVDRRLVLEHFLCV